MGIGQSGHEPQEHITALTHHTCVRVAVKGIWADLTNSYPVTASPPVHSRGTPQGNNITYAQTHTHAKIRTNIHRTQVYPFTQRHNSESLQKAATVRQSEL